MACDYTALSAYLDGELGEAKRRLLEAHVKECSDCAAELQSLERVKAMVTACALPAGMHGRLLGRIESEDRKRRLVSRSWFWATLAAASILVTVGLYWSMGPSGEPEMPAVAPLLTKHETSERQKLAQIETPKPPASAPTAPAPPLEETKLALQLQGTVKGTVPQAIIVRTDTGKSATYGVGQEVLPGLRLTEVRDKEVILAGTDGKQRTLSMADNPAPEAVSIAGLWKGTFRQGDAVQGDPITIQATDEGGRVTMKIVESDSNNPPLEGQRTGRQLVLAAQTEGFTFRFEGTLDNTLTKMTGHATESHEEGGVQFSVELTRVPEEDVRELAAQAKLEAEREAELKEMFAPLKAYADAHGDKFPDALNQLVPAQVADLTLYENRPDRNVEYLPGATTRPWSALDFDTFHPDLAMGERLIAYERQLELLWGSEIPARSVLRVTYTNTIDKCVDKYTISTAGNTSKATLCGNPAASSAEDTIAVDRATSQNNLKQLVVVEKMFASENKGFTPPGWVSMYPEYLTDADICTAPWDEPGTNSYQILFPAATEEELEALAAELAVRNPNYPTDPDAPDYRAKLQSCLPFIIEKRPDPRNPVGRNVAFLDGHVGFVKNEAWNTLVGPFAR